MTSIHTRGAALGVAAALVLAGCSPGAATPAASGSSAPPDAPITLQVMSATVVEKPDGAAEEAMAKAFTEENPNITIEFIGTPMNEMYAKLATMATGGNMPDVFTNSPEFYGQASDMGIVEPLNELLGQDYVDGFESATIKQAEIDGDLQFAPFFTIPTGLLYRMDMFEAEGITPPETWDEFVAAAQKLTKDLNGDGQPDQWGFALVGSNNGSGGSRFVPIMRTFGAKELVEKDGAWATEYGTEEATEAFQFYGDLVNKYKVVPPGPFQTSYAEAVSLMATGKTAMMVTGPHSIGAITTQTPALKGKLAGVPLPHAPGEEPAAALGMLGFSISAQSKHKEAAAEYLKFILNKENQLKWNEVTGRLPTRTDAAQDPQIQRPELKGFLDAQQFAFAMPAVPFYADVQLYATEGYQAVISGQATAAEAAELAATKTETAIQQNR